MATRMIQKTELRDRIRQELADLGDDTLVITDRGRPAAVAVSVERWNQLQDRIEDLEDAVTILEHRLHPGATRPHERVFAEIEADAAHVSGPTRPRR